MNVLLISDVYFPRINGVSTSIRSFASGLRDLGHTVTLAAPDYGDAQELWIEPGDGTLRVPARAIPFDPEDRLMRRDAVRTLVRHLGEVPFDIVHSQTPFLAYRIGRQLQRRGKPHVTTYHTHFQDYARHYLPWLPAAPLEKLARRMTQQQCRQADGVIAPSRPIAKVLADYEPSIESTILPTGLQLGEIPRGRRDVFRERLEVDDRRPILLTVGRVAFEKNLGFLLDVAARVRTARPDALLVVAGEGPALPWLRREIAARGLEGLVRCVGYLDRHRDLWDCYAAADVFVFASRTETQGLVLLESMAQGVPVVSLAYLGARDILEGERGALVAEDDSADFSAKVVRLLSDAPLRRQKATEALEFVREWSSVEMCRRLEKVYAEAMVRRSLTAENQSAASEQTNSPRTRRLWSASRDHANR